MAPMAESEKDHKQIKRICCIGAGYVVSTPIDPGARLPSHMLIFSRVDPPAL